MYALKAPPSNAWRQGRVSFPIRIATERCLCLCFASKFNALFRIWLPATIPQSEHTSNWCNWSERAGERARTSKPFLCNSKNRQRQHTRKKREERETNNKHPKSTDSMSPAIPFRAWANTKHVTVMTQSTVPMAS